MVKDTLQRLRHIATATPSKLPQAETDWGFNYNANNFLLDDDLDIDIIDVLRWDWPHIYFIKGAFHLEINALLYALTPHRLGHEALRLYLQRWEWPGGYADPKGLIQVGKYLNGTASEQVSVCPVLRKFLLDVVVKRNVCQENVSSALALIKVIGLLQNTSSGFAHPDLHDAIVYHLTKHLECYGEELWIPKHHYSIHLAQHQTKMYNTFVLERKHKTPKRFSMGRENKISYEQGLIEDVTVDQLQHLDDAFKMWDVFPRLSAASARIAHVVSESMPHNSDVYQAACARTRNGRQIHWSDVVTWRGGDGARMVGQVHFHVQIGGEAWTCVSEWSVQETSGNHLKCIVRYAPVFIDTERLVDACVFSKARAGEISHVLMND